jgi:2-amino-4-hydroxy-6-hydroxymethyldihydropteridine diphosphokinase
LSELDDIHELAGRYRSTDRFMARELDIDLLLYDQLQVVSPELTLPREDILHYGFVLLPLCEIAPTLIHPVTGIAIEQHLASFDPGDHMIKLVEVDI